MYDIYKKDVDILLFDGAGYEKSIAFEHEWLRQIGENLPPKMIAGKIDQETNLENIDIIECKLDDSWMRDIAPIFYNEDKR